MVQRRGLRADRACDTALQEILSVSLVMRPKTFRVQFQFLSAIQTWWWAFGIHGAPLAAIRLARDAVFACGGKSMPTAADAAEDQHWVSTKEHQEVVEALPFPMRSSVRLEEFVFPFWLDVLLPAASE